MTRWHEDDLGGRILQTQGNRWEVLTLPAFAEAGDPLGRALGEPLWDDDNYGYAAELAEIYAEYELSGALRDWGSLYQQNPTSAEGSLFKTEKIGAEAVPRAGAIKIARAWDLAATADMGTRDPDYTVGVKMARYPDGTIAVLHVQRFRGGPEAVTRAIRNVAAMDGKGVVIGLPQDPGQAGKMQVLHLTSMLAGYIVESSPETGDKATRAAPFASQVNVGNVMLIAGGWNKDYLDELASFPGTRHDDQVDASSRAFDMIAVPTYDTSLGWVV